MTRRPRLALGIVALGILLCTAAPGGAQPATSPEAAAAGEARPAAQSATLFYANRPIVELRAVVLGRSPAERAASARLYLDRLNEELPFSRVATKPLGTAVSIGLDDRPVFMILPEDVDALAGETVPRTAAAAAAALQTALDESRELDNPEKLMWAGLLATAATLIYIALLWALRPMHRVGTRRLSSTTERQLGKLAAGGDLVRASRLPEVLQWFLNLVSIGLGLVFTYLWATFVLRRFPYTRPWGESLRVTLTSTLVTLGERTVAALPDVLTVLVIFLATRFAVRLSNYAFAALEEGRVAVAWLAPEVATPTKRIAGLLLWLLGLVAAYPYLPGSSSDAFKGVSVLVGLMISLGSSGIMNQVMSGLTITYSRAVRVGDLVKIGDVEGIVESLGVLSLKVKTVRRESITLPNALVVGASTINYSRFDEPEGVMVPTAVTIGYDTPWRQVEALLLLAAARTPGVRRDPAPIVRQTGLFDFYIQYTLLVCPEHPHLRYAVLHALHGHILDAFNEFGVQITSPNYEADPGAAKVVARADWYAAPAVPPAGATPTRAAAES